MRLRILFDGAKVNTTSVSIALRKSSPHLSGMHNDPHRKAPASEIERSPSEPNDQFVDRSWYFFFVHQTGGRFLVAGVAILLVTLYFWLG